ncbi:MAG: N-acyl-D-amino-acid deacylase family protein, partial [Candidatus Zipacnadales bacterium]
MFDLLLLNGLLVDGSGAPPRRADLGIVGERIDRLGDLKQSLARQRLDCTGLTVAPGFIDLHAHSELTLLVNPLGESKLHQGVTTELNGQCGLAPFPVKPESREALRAVCAFIDAPVPWEWQHVDEYLTLLEQQRPAYNVAVLVGQSALRAWVMGFEARPATPDELVSMCALLTEALARGAVGVSLGLSYPLGSFCDREEALRLAGTCAIHAALVTVHLRNEGPGLMTALDEMLGIAEETGCRLQIAHLKCVGPPQWGQAEQVLERIERAVRAGINVAYDVYPYTAGSRHLYGSLPGWVLDGGIEPMIERLRRPEVREQLRQSLTQWAEGKDTAGGFALDFANTMITSVQSEANAACVGLRLDEIARQRGQEPLEATLDLLIEEKGQVNCVLWAMSEDDVREFLKHPLGCITTDGLAYAPYGPLANGAPHPRCYCTYAPFLGKDVRAEGRLSLAEAVRKCTSLPASR